MPIPIAVTRAGIAAAIVAATVFVFPRQHHAQDAVRVDFVRDVQPLLRQHCTSCHGPAQQMAGLRLDRRSAAMRGSTQGTVIGPGNGAASRMYLRVSGDTFGMQMPPTGKLPPEQIALIKTWIDQGAEWPDAAAGDAPPVPADPAASRLLRLLRSGDQAGFRRALAGEPGAAARHGEQGITPLMYAALYGDVAAMTALLDRGADPNVANDAGATALMWAATDLDKTRLLLARAANVRARSNDGRTPLHIAAARAGSSDVVRVLLDAGADPNIEANGMTPLGEAAYAADLAAMTLLLARGADASKGLMISALSAATSNCRECLERLLPSFDAPGLAKLALFISPPNDNGDELGAVLDRGASVAEVDRDGRSLAMLAAASDAASASLMQRLVALGADLSVRGKRGETALGFARQRGRTAVVDVLSNAHAADATIAALPASVPSPAPSPRAAVERALPLLQRTGATFRTKAGCVSCHNNTLLAMSVAAARDARIRVDEEMARDETRGIGGFLEIWRERALQGIGIPGDADTVSSILLGLADERYPADAATDAMARYIVHRQLADGGWRIIAHRPPIESSDIQVTAASMRALQVYAPAVDRAKYQRATASAAGWLRAASPSSTEDRTWQLRALHWASADRAAIARAGRALVAEQRGDGGWAQLPTLESDAYATGQALVALVESGASTVNDPAYRRGVAYLLRTQCADGSWQVPSRALAIQPLFDIGFPHHSDSWISAAATNWATTALARAAGAAATAPR